MQNETKDGLTPLTEFLNSLAPSPTTGIGSLPHPNTDTALKYSFRHDIPYLPQIPIRNSREYMISQTLNGIPGLKTNDSGEVSLELTEWNDNAHRFSEKLETSFKKNDLSDFEPKPDFFSCWQPFLFELQERNLKVAKFQLAGPLTCQWALKSDQTAATQVFRLCMAKTIAMTRKLKSIGVTPIVFLDEPGLYIYTGKDPMHVLAIQELKLVIQALRKEKALVGLHCCSNTNWNSILSLGLDILSIDAELSLASILNQTVAASNYIERGGRFCLGVIPTGKAAGIIQSLEPEALFDRLVQSLDGKVPSIKDFIKNSIFSPACGLALHSAEDSEAILQCLKDFQSLCRQVR